MSDDLFPPEAGAMLSPKLQWLRDNKIITLYHAPGDRPPTWFAGFQHWHPTFSGEEFFVVETGNHGDLRIGEGDTEDEALADLMSCWDARKRNLRLWNEHP